MPCFVCDPDVSADEWTMSNEYCYIAEQCYNDGALNSNNSCNICNISDSGLSQWSLNAGHCLINSECYKDGNSRPGVFCHVCDSSKSSSEWSADLEYCFIEGECEVHGEINTENSCLLCNISDAGNYMWSKRSNGGEYIISFLDPVCKSVSNVQSRNPCYLHVIINWDKQLYAMISSKYETNHM